MATANQIKKELKKGPDISIISLVDFIIEHAHGLRASDVHVDPLEDSVRVRMRIDGVLQDVHSLPKDIHAEIISRIKILAGLRTDEHQAAQDGRFRLDMKKLGPVDIRVSIAPTYYGENAVMRLLADRSQEFSIDTLGFSEKDRIKIKQAIRNPYGMILATGPTGSGKTTTLYTIIQSLNNKDVSITTIEDPIEYAIPGIRQVQINPRTGLTFASGLRAFLRQDPDILMVGEIRDSETAALAVNTALTGHLLLSTLHTNDAATTLPRLLDMGVEPFLVASTVNIALGQRLVRKICPDCKTEHKITETERLSLLETGLDVGGHEDFYEGAGCETCNQSGYLGRIGIYEVLALNPRVREAILNKLSASEIKRIAVEEGMTTMVEDGLEKAKAGITSINEILRVIHE